MRWGSAISPGNWTALNLFPREIRVGQGARPMQKTNPIRARRTRRIEPPGKWWSQERRTQRPSLSRGKPAPRPKPFPEARRTQDRPHSGSRGRNEIRDKSEKTNPISLHPPRPIEPARRRLSEARRTRSLPLSPGKSCPFRPRCPCPIEPKVRRPIEERRTQSALLSPGNWRILNPFPREIPARQGPHRMGKTNPIQPRCP